MAAISLIRRLKSLVAVVEAKMMGVVEVKKHIRRMCSRRSAALGAESLPALSEKILERDRNTEGGSKDNFEKRFNSWHSDSEDRVVLAGVSRAKVGPISG